MLDVAPAVLSAREAESFEAHQRHAFGFDFAEATRCDLGIGQAGFSFERVTEHDVCEFMEAGFVREFRAASTTLGQPRFAFSEATPRG